MDSEKEDAYQELSDLSSGDSATGQVDPGPQWREGPDDQESGVNVLSGANPMQGRRAADMPMSVLTGVLIAIVGVICFIIGKEALIALATIAIVLMMVEFYAALGKVGYEPAILIGVVAAAGLPLAVYWRGADGYPVVLGISAVATLLWFLFEVSSKPPIPNIGATFLGIFYVGLLGSFAGLILSLEDGKYILLAAVLGSVGYDVGGWLIGGRIGRLPMSKISPGKTMEGLVGGMFLSLILSVLVIQIFNLAPLGDGDGTLSDTLILGIVMAVVAPFGDICESLLKRNLKIKDMGNILPGHGGVLDRFDSLLFVLPAAYYTVVILELAVPV